MDTSVGNSSIANPRISVLLQALISRSETGQVLLGVCTLSIDDSNVARI